MVITKREDVPKQGLCKLLWRKLRLRGSLLLVLIQLHFNFKWVGWGWALIWGGRLIRGWALIRINTVCSYCCNRHLCYDGERLGRVKMVTLRVGARGKEGKRGGPFSPLFSSFARPKKTPALPAMIERFSYDLEIKKHEQNRNNKRTQIERVDWFIELIQTRVAFGWLSERWGEKSSCPRTF